MSRLRNRLKALRNLRQDAKNFFHEVREIISSEDPEEVHEACEHIIQEAHQSKDHLEALLNAPDEDLTERRRLRDFRRNENRRKLNQSSFLQTPAFQQVPQPFMLEGMECYTFLLEASAPGALQNYVDRTLNNVAEGGVCYRVLMNHVIVYMAPIAKMYSSNDELKAGWTTDKDAGFWLLLGEYEFPDDHVEDDTILNQFLKKLILFPVGLFVGSSYTLISGREIYGLPKALGSHKMPRGPEDEGPFWVRTLLAREYDLEKEFEDGEVWSIQHRHGEHFELPQECKDAWLVQRSSFLPKLIGERLEKLHEGLERLKYEAEEKAEELLAGFEHLIEDSVHGGKHLLQSILLPLARSGVIDFHGHEQFLHEDWHDLVVNQVFLKQFRSAEDPHVACYQSVVEAPFIVRNFEQAGLMTKMFDFHIQPAESLNLDKELGLKPKMKVLVGIWAKMDCVLDRGKVRWVRYDVPYIEETHDL